MNILLVILDALRADRFSPAHMPRTWSLTSNWQRFSSAYSCAPWTLPAATSLLSGRWAHDHDNFFHGTFSAPTLATVLRNSYETIAVTNNPNFNPELGILNGFESTQVIRPPEHREVFSRALQMLAVPQTRPRFMVVHSNTAHDYNYAESVEYWASKNASRDGWFHLGAKVIDWSSLPRERRGRVPQLYDASVDGLDRQLSAFLSAVDLSSSTVVLTSDHGEGFDAGRYRFHHGGRLHDDLLRVPLLIHTPEPSFKDALQQKSSADISHVDIAPTITDLLSLAPHEHWSGQSLIRPLEPRWLFSSERRYFYVRRGLRLNAKGRGKHMSPASVKLSEAFNALFREPPLWVSMRRGFRKIVLRRYRPKLGGRAIELILRALFGRSIYIHRAGYTFALDAFDLARDPMEDDPRSGWTALGNTPDDVPSFQIAPEIDARKLLLEATTHQT
jgi:arylsulfatase A-like enzyme